MEAGEEKGGWESGFYFLIFTDIVKMGWDTKPARNEKFEVLHSRELASRTAVRFRL